MGVVNEDLAGWAERTARDHLSDLPRRLAHVEGVASRAEHVADLVDDHTMLLAAAWLHDIGYSASLARTGFHPVDGATYLRDVGAPPRLCALVANHTCARVEARRRELTVDWPDEDSLLRDALWWADITTTPTGEETTVRTRIAEVRERYGPDDIVSESVAEAEPELIAAAERIEAALRAAHVK